MNATAFFLVLAGAGVHATWNLAARRVRGDLVVVWSSLWIGFLVLLPVWAVTRLGGDSAAFDIAWRGLACGILSGLVHTGYFTLLGAAYRYGDISVVYPVARGSAVALVAAMASLLLGERLSVVGALGIVLIACGILSSAFERGRSSRGWVFALLVGVTTTAYSLVDKIGVGYIDPVSYILTIWIVVAVALTPIVWKKRKGRIREDFRRGRAAAAVVGVGCIGAYLLVLFAMRLAPASYVCGLREVSVVPGAVGGFLLFGERMTAPRLLGLVAIVLGCCSIKLA